MSSLAVSSRSQDHASSVSAIRAIASEAINAIRDLTTQDTSMRSPPAPQERRGSHLLDLPAEVRFNIFGYVFQGRNIVTRDIKEVDKRGTDLRFLSKHLYPELNRAFFKHSNFNIDRINVVRKLRHSATYFKDKSFDHIHYLTIIWTPTFIKTFESREGDSKFIYQMPNLRCLTLDLLGCRRIYMPDNTTPQDKVKKVALETRSWPLLFWEIVDIPNPTFDFHVLVYVNELKMLRIDWRTQALLQEYRYPVAQYLLALAKPEDYTKWSKEGLRQYRSELMSMHLSLKAWGNC